MSASQEIIVELLGRGMSRKAIGRAISRNDRLIGYVEKGQKPGENLAGALAELRARLDAGEGSPARPPTVGEPARRVHTDAHGRTVPVRVRRARTITGRSGQWSTTTLRRQAVKGGGGGVRHALEAAAKRGQDVAITVGVTGAAAINGTSGGRIVGGEGATMELGPASQVLADLDQRYGGDFTMMSMAELSAAGFVSFQGDPHGAAASIEVRTY